MSFFRRLFQASFFHRFLVDFWSIFGRFLDVFLTKKCEKHVLKNMCFLRWFCKPFEGCMRLIATTLGSCKHRLYIGFYGVFLTCRFFDRVDLFCFFIRFSLSFGTRNPAKFRVFLIKIIKKVV